MAFGERSTARLRDADLLLVFDNCEHLREACGELAQTCSPPVRGLRILATSRELLGVPGEADYPVPPLALPAAGAEPAELRASEAVRLFLARAREARPRLADDDAGARERRPDLPRSRRAAARDRARRGPREGALARRDRGPARRALPLPRLVAPADRGPPPDARARRWTGATSCSTTSSARCSRAVRLRRRLHARRRRVRLRGRRRRTRRRARRTAGGRVARRRRGARRRDALSPARDGPAVRRGAARRGREESPIFRRRHADSWSRLRRRHGTTYLAHLDVWVEHLGREHDNLRAALAWSRAAGEHGAPGAAGEVDVTVLVGPWLALRGTGWLDAALGDAEGLAPELRAHVLEGRGRPGLGKRRLDRAHEFAEHGSAALCRPR